MVEIRILFFAKQRSWLQLTAGSTSIRKIESTFLAVSSRVVTTRAKAFRPIHWHKHTTVSCCIATANTGISSAKDLTRLMDLFSISRVTKKSLGLTLISEVTKVVWMQVPSLGAIHGKN